MMKVGDRVPDFFGKDENGKECYLQDFKGKKIILYFYPKDNTPGCTAEACSFRDGLDELINAGYAVVGVSPDSETSHLRFKAKQMLDFTLIADVDKTLIKQFGVWGEKKMMGRVYEGVYRTTFLISSEGIVERVITNVDTKNAAKQILQM